MAVWLPAQNKFYLPPQPNIRVLHTDEYVQRTSIFYHASTDRLLTVGHPFYQTVTVGGDTPRVKIPKVSPNQFRVFRLRLPDPNNFAFGDKSIFDPEKERLVWGVRGIEVQRGGPLGVSVTGHVLFDKYNDVENSRALEPNGLTDERVNIAFDPKQTQMFMLGCKPAIGEYWTQAEACTRDQEPIAGLVPVDGDCPPIELKNRPIQDGDMADLGFGNLDFKTLQQNRSGVPLELVDEISMYPDYIKMINDPSGDHLFFFVRREQIYARHFFTRSGLTANNEAVPNDLYINYDQTRTRIDNKPLPSSNYFSTPSGSLVSSEGQLFNRPYWIQKSQGQNNGIAWMNELFLTVVDNTRGTPYTITVHKDNPPAAPETPYKPENYKGYLRHTEEFDIALILQLCKVALTPENLAIVHTMNPDVIENWHLNVSPPAGDLEEHYRYIRSAATKCPAAVVPKDKPDPYKGLRFWDIDLTDKMTDQLDQTPLGRKFLYQTGMSRYPSSGRSGSFVAKRVRYANSPAEGKPSKRRRIK
nr:MAG: L1 protein [Leptonychotes weddellii papillomavirus 9]